MKSFSTSALKHPLWASLLLVVFFCLIMLIPDAKIFFLLSGGSEYTQQAQYLVSFLLRLVGFVLCLLWLVKQGYAAALKFNRPGFRKGLGIIWPAFIVIAILFPFGPVFEGTYRMDVSLLIPMLLKYTGVGMIEEIFFRAAILLILLSAWHTDKNGAYKAALASSVLFGSAHLINLLFLLYGQDVLLATVAQIITATFVGVFFAGIYLRTKNIWLCMLIHALADIADGFSEIAVKTANAATAVPAPPSIAEALIQCAIILPFGLYGLFLLRKADWEDFKSLQQPETAVSNL